MTEQTNQYVSPYVLAKMISEELGKTIQPQRIYGEVRKNKIASRRNNLGHLEVNVTEASKWCEAYIAKHSTKK